MPARAAAATPLLLVLLTGAAPAGTLEIDVGNVRDARGQVHVDLCTETTFLHDGCAISANAPARAGTTQVVLHGVPAGRYAIQAFHDENGNGRVDRALLGVPKEGVGFSRDAPIRLSPPKWADAVFAFDGAAGRTALKMRYFLGAHGPAER